MSELAPGGGRVACIGVDVGGTFTDAVLTDGDPHLAGQGADHTATTSATASSPPAGSSPTRAGPTLEALLPSVGRFGLGTTAVTNVLASRTGRRVGLITTKGFEELVPLARGRRVNEDGWLMMPPEIVGAAASSASTSASTATARVVTPLDPAEVVPAARQPRRRASASRRSPCRSSGRSATRSTRSRPCGASADVYPDLPVMSGCRPPPGHPRVRAHDLRPAQRLRRRARSPASSELAARAARRSACACPLLLVHSGGGSITVAEARRVPIDLAESGPAAGVAAAVGGGPAQRASTDAVTCDMGGTSFDVSVVERRPADAAQRGAS